MTKALEALSKSITESSTLVATPDNGYQERPNESR